MDRVCVTPKHWLPFRLTLHRYEKTQTIHGLPQPEGLKRCEKLPEPIFTPSTKAELGEKDENISPDEARKIVGDKYASRIEELALSCYKAGAAYAEERGIIIVGSSASCMTRSEVREFTNADSGGYQV